MLYWLLILLLPLAEAAEKYSCDARYDKLNITHQSTASLEHFYYCFGFHHGKDRAWEMDHFRRVGQGRSAEVLGFSQLKSDLMMRLLNLDAHAEKIWANFEGEKKKLLEVYSQGVNNGFLVGPHSSEFQKLDYIPEAWKPQHTILVLLLQSFDQTRKTFMNDYEEEKKKEKWKDQSRALFDEDEAPWENNILKEGEYPKKEKAIVKTPFSGKPLKLWEEFPTVFGLESGSNNWVVSKKKSKTGKALFANDPHLDLKTPLFWYWVNFKSPDGNVMGASVPGVPVVVSGTNGKLAWGLTNSYMNAADVVYLKDLPATEVESIRPRVDVKIGFFKLPFIFKSFERLKTGHPILPLETENKNKLALRWTGFSLSSQDFYPMFDLHKAQKVSELHHLVLNVGIPSWNFVYADIYGDIGYGMVGKTYKVTGKSSYGIPEMTLAEFLSSETLSSQERPALLKPKRDYIYTANNRHWPPEAKYYGGRGYSLSLRGYRIDELLQSQQDAENFKNIQCDQQVVDARFFLPKLQRYLNVSEFQNWSMQAVDDSKVLPLYRRLMDITMERWQINEYAFYRMLDDLTPHEQKELKSFLNLARQEVAGRSWSELLKLKFPHMSKREDLKFSPEIAGVGDKHTVNPGTARWNPDQKHYEQYSGASMRLIIEMDEPPNIWLALPGLNRAYDRQAPFSPWEEWRNCQYQQVNF